MDELDDRPVVRLSLTLDPLNPDEFFGQVDDLTISILKQTKFLTPRYVRELLDGMQLAKDNARQQIRDMIEMSPGGVG